VWFEWCGLNYGNSIRSGKGSQETFFERLFEAVAFRVRFGATERASK
jgi:hypothetical protein